MLALVLVALGAQEGHAFTVKRDIALGQRVAAHFAVSKSGSRAKLALDLPAGLTFAPQVEIKPGAPLKLAPTLKGEYVFFGGRLESKVAYLHTLFSATPGVFAAEFTTRHAFEHGPLAATFTTHGALTRRDERTTLAGDAELRLASNGPWGEVAATTSFAVADVNRLPISASATVRFTEITAAKVVVETPDALSEPEQRIVEEEIKVVHETDGLKASLLVYARQQRILNEFGARAKISVFF